ncbi:MAG: CmpX protein [Candidatus Jorgensenbacteria bacterium GW2011_GWA2_45_13]|uniref:CmpX protein n=1 Tax=Candidatus Jorgensenbacteria bacterium GW2011_GWA2_45_13 TaxID=1618662 RepID=A0A0G1P6X0_9BACT|nr:MAG: CmpX protein [Candidatus Jorgensenbacteria bacterium GW2011_GWA2_45_13]
MIQDWTSVVIGSLQNLWVGAIATLGSIIGAFIILLVGLIVAAGLAALIERVVSFVKLDKALSGLGLEEYFSRAGISLNSAKFFGKIVYWFFVVVFLLAASDILGFYSLSTFLKDTLLYIPNVVVAVLIMLAAVVIANFLKRLVGASVKTARLHASKFLSSLTWWAVVLFGFFAALTQLGVAVSIINSLVTGFVAMLAIAGGIAFGLGGKDYASHLISKLREHVE